MPDEPFRIASNLYYVGATGVTAFLLTGPEGHVLIDGGYPETAPLIIASIARLGFDIRNVKVLLNSHAHFDHEGGLRELQEPSGAKLWISEGDAEMIAGGGAGDRSFGPARFLGVGRFPAARVGHRFRDGDTIRTYRLRLVHLIPDWTAWIALLRDDSPEEWRPLAKDGAELHPAAQVLRRATLLAGPGETMDFEYTPTHPGVLRLEAEQRTGIWKTALPIRVER